MPRAFPFTRLMVTTEINVLRRLHGMLEHDRVASREEFGDLMKAAFEHGKLDSRQLADEMGFSASSIYRWIEGKSAPHQSLWPTVVNWIMKAIEDRIHHYEESCLEAHV